MEIGQASVVRKHFPNATFSEYGTIAWGIPNNCVPDSNGFNICNVSTPPASTTPSGTGLAIAGTVQSPPIYMAIGKGFAAWLKTYEGVDAYALTAFNAARAMVNTVRAGVFAAATKTPPEPMRPYLSYKSFPNSLGKASDYYQEMVLHAALAGASVFNLWNTHANATLGDNAVVGGTLAELEVVVGGGPRRSQDRTLASWTDGFLLSRAFLLPSGNHSAAAASDGRCVWRFSPDMTGMPASARPAQFVASRPGDGFVALSVRGVNVTIPGAAVRAGPGVSARGLWIEQQGAGGDNVCPSTRDE